MPPYGNFPISAIAAFNKGWCIGLSHGDILHVNAKETWDVQKNDLAQDWPSWFPIVMKVKTSDGEEWWARVDQLGKHTELVE